MKVQKLSLCGKCAALMKTAFEVKKISGGANFKVLCENCGRKRFGGVYELTKGN